MDWNDVRRLVKLVESSNIQEVELEQEGSKIRIRKFDPNSVVTVAANPVSAPVYAQPAAAPLPASAPVSIPAPAPVEPRASFHEIKSPMVGTFYRSPAPDADPYIQVGDKIKVGQPLCIVEAMKLMNEIESDVDGRVVEIVIDNQKPVEFGQVMFRIDTKG